MSNKKKSMKHTYYLPQNVGKISLDLEKGHFINVSNSDLQKIFSIVGNIVYGLLIDMPSTRRILIEFLEGGIDLLPLKVENKNENLLLKIAGLLFEKGDYKNALYVYEIILSKLLKTTNSKNISDLFTNLLSNDDKIFEIIGLLNSISYINSKLKCNLEESKTVSHFLYDYICQNFNDDNYEILSLKAAIADTIGSIYLNDDKIDKLKKALNYLKIANTFDKQILKTDLYDPISIRLTLYKMGEAYLKLGEKYFYNKNVSKYFSDIHEYLNEAISCFESVDIIKAPVINDKDLISAELNEVLNLSAKGILKARGMLIILKDEQK